MLDTTKVYKLIPVWMTLMFVQGHRVTGKLLHQATEMFMMVDYVREMTVKRSYVDSLNICCSMQGRNAVFRIPIIFFCLCYILQNVENAVLSKQQEFDNMRDMAQKISQSSGDTRTASYANQLVTRYQSLNSAVKV